MKKSIIGCFVFTEDECFHSEAASFPLVAFSPASWQVRSQDHGVQRSHQDCRCWKKKIVTLASVLTDEKQLRRDFQAGNNVKYFPSALLLVFGTAGPTLIHFQLKNTNPHIPPERDESEGSCLRVKH